MPSFPVIDTHLHLWDPALLRYPWLDEIPLLNRSFLLEDYRAATTELQIDKMVFVQCECEPVQAEEEVAWITSIAKTDERIKGIVGWAPLEKGLAAREVLERYADNRLVKGIRRIIQFEKDPLFCIGKEFIEGVQLLAEYDFTFDLCVSHHQLAQVKTLVSECPKVQFVLDHVGKPNIKSQCLEPWRSDLKELSRFENIFCKVSGLVTEADQANWKKEDLVAYTDSVLEFFTAERLMFGGDWPVVLRAAEYQDWFKCLDWLVSNLSHDELIKLYRKNAENFYRLA